MSIVLSTLNARYSHASLGLRYLMANMGALASRNFRDRFDAQRVYGEMIEHLLVRIAGSRLPGRVRDHER